MAKVYYDELTAAMASDIFDRLEADKRESQAVKEVLSTFISSSQTVLTGQQYNSYRSQLATFNNALDQRMNLDEALSTNIRSALQLLIDYMDGDLYLDSSKLEEYMYYRELCVNSIDKLNYMLNEMYEVRYTDSAGRVQVTSTPVYDSNEVRQQITQAEEALTELDRVIVKVQGLDAVYAQAESILNSAFQGITPFGNAVTSIKPDGLFSYRVV